MIQLGRAGSRLRFFSNYGLQLIMSGDRAPSATLGSEGMFWGTWGATLGVDFMTIQLGWRGGFYY